MDSGTVEEHPSVVDLPVLLAIPVLLVAVHALVPSARRTLVFDHSHLDPLRMWTSAYVHLDWAHLRSNVLGYGIAIVPTYTLYRVWGRRRQFWVAVAVLLLVGPWVVTAGSYAVFRFVYHLDGVVTRGFSGIVGGFAGLLWASVPAYVGDRYGRWRAIEVGLVVLLVPLVGLLVSVSGISNVTAVVVAVGLMAALVNVVPRELWGDPGELRTVFGNEWVGVATVGYCVIALTILLTNLFPIEVAKGGSVTNIFAHSIGIVFGIFVSAAIIMKQHSI